MATRSLNYEERLMYVTRNLVQYGEYGRDVNKAAEIVKKYFKNKSLEQCTQSLTACAKAYEAGIAFVEKNKESYWKKEKPTDLIRNEKMFFKDHKELSREILIPMLYGIFNWYHER